MLTHSIKAANVSKSTNGYFIDNFCGSYSVVACIVLLCFATDSTATDDYDFVIETQDGAKKVVNGAFLFDTDIDAYKHLVKELSKR